MAFQIKNLSTIGDPLLQEALKSIEDTINQSGNTAGVNPAGVATAPQNAGSITVTQANGVYDVVINDSANERGEIYFVEWSLSSSFAPANMIQLGAARSWRGYLGLAANSYWRFYKQLQGSNPSAWINCSANPIGHGGTAGPTPQFPQGSGSSNQSGRGLGPIGG